MVTTRAKWGPGMAVAKLTKRVVDGLAATPGKPLYVYDTELKGLGVRCMPSGVKSWIVEYRPPGRGRGTSRKRMTLGPTTTLTPDEARKAARNVLAAVQLGADPARERRKGRETPTVAQLLEQYLTEEVKPKRKPRTAELYRYYARNLIVPNLGPIKAPALQGGRGAAASENWQATPDHRQPRARPGVEPVRFRGLARSRDSRGAQPSKRYREISRGRSRAVPVHR